MHAHCVWLDALVVMATMHLEIERVGQGDQRVLNLIVDVNGSMSLLTSGGKIRGRNLDLTKG